MDFSFTDEQLNIKESVIKFAKGELNEGALEREQEGQFFWDGWKKCAEFGIFGLPLPKKYGGLEVTINPPNRHNVPVQSASARSEQQTVLLVTS